MTFYQLENHLCPVCKLKAHLGSFTYPITDNITTVTESIQECVCVCCGGVIWINKIHFPSMCVHIYICWSATLCVLSACVCMSSAWDRCRRSWECAGVCAVCDPPGRARQVTSNVEHLRSGAGQSLAESARGEWRTHSERLSAKQPPRVQSL